MTLLHARNMVRGYGQLFRIYYNIFACAVMQLVRIFVLYLVNCITVNCKLLAEACCYKSSYGLWRSTV